MPPTPLDFLIPALIISHVLLCPYTKVEESFNLQATHDIINHGVGSSELPHFDHREFPGVVPRTFLGALWLSFQSWPVLKTVQLLGTVMGHGPEDGSLWRSKFLGQYVARIFLGLLTAFSLLHVRRAVKTVFGHPASVAFVFLTCSQFHTIFWTSRTLPNMFAFPLGMHFNFNSHLDTISTSHHSPSTDPNPPATIAFSFHIILPLTRSSNQLRIAVRYMIFTAVIFRFEVGILLVPVLALEWLWFHRITLAEVVLDVLATMAAALPLTVVIDSYFWGEWPVWPEAAVFWFNGVEGRSVEWGVLPFHAYFTTFLPRLLLISLPLAVYACAVDPRPRRHVIPATVYVVFFSLLGHKEWRFVVYIVPVFNVAASVGLSKIYIRSLKSPAYRILLALVGLGLLASFAASTVMAWVSSYNYPGGHALRRLHELRWETEDIRVHMDVYTAMTGASRFGEVKGRWSYFKTETHTTPDSYTAANYTHLLTSTPALHEASYAVLDVITGYDGLRVKRPRAWVADVASVLKGALGWSEIVERVMPVKVVKGDKVWVMEKNAE
ncbi:Alg9-like mannosyltransferase family-domain-containing protein [Jimgerdemannia flammicorona]|uniref:Mannosyltransferase n=1 Tax=Jimgerdemannia flammicorona TaxID=994334 RepID=A0A433DNE6_9FUNG|nr:Alg9-like mannosyltransferase family-domain-containing protein [Jimgerdemannia flammicorona]